MKYLRNYNNRTEFESEMYENKPFVTYVGSENSLYYSGNSINIPDSLKQKVRALWIVDGKSNEDLDRDTIKDMSGNGHDLKLSGFSFNKNSGYGKYETDFNDWTLNYSVLNKQIVTFNRSNIQGVFFCNIPNSYKVDIPSFKVNVDFTVSTNNSPAYYYWNEDGTREFIYLTKGINILPINYASKSNDSHLTGSGFHDSFCDSVIIEQIPEYQGAVVTDGVDDIIQSNDSIKDILSNSNKITVLSMIRQLDRGNQSIIRTNFIGMAGSNSDTWVNNLTSEIGTTGIYGYSVSDLNNSFPSVISNILGDDHLYTVDSKIDHSVLPNFTVNGFVRTGDHIDSVSSVAWYWTLIANDVLTKDEIELLISYYDLDRWIRPIAYYNPKRQGLTNDNHTEFNDKLLDLSGNGRDLTLYNFSYDLGSGINKYPVSFGKNKTWNDIPKNFTVEYTGSEAHITHANHAGNGLFFHYVYQSGKLTNIKEIPSFRIRISGLENGSKFVYRYLATENAVKETLLRLGNGIHDLPKSFTPTSNLVGDVWVGSTISSTDDGTIEFDCDIKLDILPEIEGALVFDGIDDYAQYQGELGLKDYTVIVDREYQESIATQVPIVSHISSSGSVNTPFLIEHLGLSKILAPHSYGKYTEVGELNISRFTSYQSTYKYNGTDITKGTSTNTGNGLTIGRFGNERQYAMICLYSMLIYPYSMSKFLMNRQLEKYNLNKLI